MAWQEPGTLRADLEGLRSALETDALCVTLARRGNADALAEQAGALLALLDSAPAGARVRLVYAL